MAAPLSIKGAASIIKTIIVVMNPIISILLSSKTKTIPSLYFYKLSGFFYKELYRAMTKPNPIIITS
ncbi:MAG: hypothetical protein R2800_15000 [Flavipsychrobacter sp.]